MLIKKKIHDSRNMKNTRFLITVNVLGSSGPLRFVVNNDDKVSEVIHSSLKMYARGGRLPVLGLDYTKFLLYPSNSESEAMRASEAVGSCGERAFVLYKKPVHPLMTEVRSEMINRRHRHQSRGWKSIQVMGSFNGWSHGEYLSADYTGSYTRFSTSIMLRPGRYEIKFLVDGEWLLSPDYPTVGEGLMENNLLIVE